MMYIVTKKGNKSHGVLFEYNSQHEGPGGNSLVPQNGFFGVQRKIGPALISTVPVVVMFTVPALPDISTPEAPSSVRIPAVVVKLEAAPASIVTAVSRINIYISCDC